jgi:hypothetical protein
MKCKSCGHPLKLLEGALVSTRTGLPSCLGPTGRHIKY